MADQVKKDPQSTHEMNLYQKLAKITGEVGIIEKGGKNLEQHFDFIEYAAVAGRLRELFSKYGVVVIPRMGKQVRTIIKSAKGRPGVWTLVQMSFNVINADKPEEKFTVTWEGEAMDFGDKATNKAATSALKYYLMRQFNISEKGEDPDADSPGHEAQVVAHQETAQDEPSGPVEPEVLVIDAPSDDQWDLLYSLAKKLNWTTKMSRINFGKITTVKQADMLIGLMEQRAAPTEPVIEDVA